MRLRNPLIALALLLALGSYVYLVEIRGGARRQKEEEAREKVLAFDPEKATALTLNRPAERIRLEKLPEGWKIREPVAADPDPEAVTRLLREVADIKTTKQLGPQADLAPFSLEPARATIEVAAGSPPLPPLQLGDDPPTGSGTYARLGQEKAIRLVSGAESVRDTTLFSLRDKTLLKFDPERLTGLELTRREEARKPGNRRGAKAGETRLLLARTEGSWRLTEPVPAPAASDTVSDLLYALERLNVTEFVDEKPSPAILAERGLEPPRYRLIAREEDWPSGKELRFGLGESGSLYAQLPATGVLVKVSDSIEAKLKIHAEDLRRKEVLGFSRFDIRKIHLEGIPGGTLELEKKDDQTWKRVSAPAGDLAAEKVDPLLAALADLKADAFLDGPGIAPGRLGLSPPAASLRIEKSGEEQHPLLLKVGRGDGKGKVPLMDEAWPSAFMVPGEQWKKVTDAAEKVARETSPPPTAPAASAPKRGEGS